MTWNPEDNSHLDDTDSVIAAETARAWNARTGEPRVGDFVKMPDGKMARCCHAWDHGMQTTLALQASYYINRDAYVSYSGSLDPTQLWERFRDTGEMMKGQFWFFHHGLPGAGRGVDLFLPCRVYEIVPLTMTEDEARSHPVAVSSAEIWGENHPEHKATIARLMDGRP